MDRDPSQGRLGRENTHRPGALKITDVLLSLRNWRRDLNFFIMPLTKEVTSDQLKNQSNELRHLNMIFEQ